MALTGTGLQIKRLPEILDDFRERLTTELGSDIDLSTDSLLGILNGIYGFSIAEQWELAQAVYSAFNIATAEGKQLDDLVALVGISRLDATATQGDMHFIGDEGTVIPSDTIVADNLGNNYATLESITMSLVAAQRVNIEPTIVADGTTYSLSVDGDTYTYISSTGDTQSDIITGLETEIGEQVEYEATVVNNELVVTSTDTLNTLNVGLVNNLQSTEMVSVNYVVGTVNGAIEANSNTITIINTPVTGLTSVNNPEALNTGRDIETDEELRLRHTRSVEVAGTATVPAIESTLNQIQGVSSAFVIENRSIETDSAGRPPKSYECVVVGGVDQDIADAIWRSKPAGIETYGNVTLTIIDSQGNIQAVSFTRPIPVFVWAEVSYTIYDEEIFPNDGEQLIKEAIQEYGDNLPLGKDVIPKRFYGSVYSAVSGIEDLTIELAVTNDPNSPPASYSPSTIDIANNQVADLDVNRITVL